MRAIAICTTVQAPVRISPPVQAALAQPWIPLDRSPGTVVERSTLASQFLSICVHSRPLAVYSQAQSVANCACSLVSFMPRSISVCFYLIVLPKK